MKKILVVLAVILLIAGVFAFLESERGKAKKPNVLLITLDTTRADHLGCYGYEPDTSPSIDRIARQGALFTRCIAQAPVTPVSHASILTGLNPYRHGLRVCHGSTGFFLPEEVVTWAEIFRDSGYETGAFVSAFPAGSRFGLDQGFAVFDENFEGEKGPEIADRGITNVGWEYQNRADTTTVRAVDWLTRREDPFFLWVHYFDPHDVWRIPPEELLDRFPRSGEEKEDILVQYYDADIYFMDLWLARLVQALDELGLREDTIIVIVADHGEGLGDHDWWTHGLLYQEQIRLPLIVSWPGRLLPQEADFLVRSVDILPTVLDLARIDPSARPGTDGVSLLPYLKVSGKIRGGEKAGREPGLLAYSDSINRLVYRRVNRVDKKDEILYSIIDGDWKLIHHQLRPGESELYKLSEDPGEENNLIEEFPRVRDRLMAELEKTGTWETELPDSGGEVDREAAEKLRSLGYVN